MEIEQLEIIGFLSRVLPLREASHAELEPIVEKIEIGYRKRNHILNIKPEFLYLIRKGAVQMEDENAQLRSVVGEKEWFGCSARAAILQHICKEDTLFYRIPKSFFFEHFADRPKITSFLQARSFKGERTRHQGGSPQHMLDDTVLSMSRANDPYLVDAHTAISEVAQIMTKKNITSVLVTSQNQLIGIVTDRAFCTKVVGGKTAHNRPIRDIMTPNPITIAHYKNGVEAMLLMADAKIRHLPIVKGKQVVGIISAADLLRKQSHNVVFLINEIHAAETPEKLAQISKQIPMVLINSFDSNLDERNITYAISSIGRAINQQLLEQAEARFGKPPVPYAWVVAGSMARSEQTAHSDQDSLMILSDNYIKAEHGDYFRTIAKYVADGMNASGYIYCPGDVMASNHRWRVPLGRWRGYFKHWIESPEPKSLMNASIFFDSKCIYGDSSLLAKLSEDILRRTQKNSIFQSFMAKNATHNSPPLGFFRHFILDKNGLDRKALNLKNKGVMPIIDFARTYALANGIGAINTEDRLRQLIEQKGLSASGGADLIEAFKFINFVRIKHQALQARANLDIDNYVLPEEISSLDKKHLKDAFEVVDEMQNAMESHFRTSIL